MCDALFVALAAICRPGGQALAAAVYSREPAATPRFGLRSGRSHPPDAPVKRLDKLGAAQPAAPLFVSC
jgi:hypothetical protein